MNTNNARRATLGTALSIGALALGGLAGLVALVDDRPDSDRGVTGPTTTSRPSAPLPSVSLPPGVSASDTTSPALTGTGSTATTAAPTAGGQTSPTPGASGSATTTSSPTADGGMASAGTGGSGLASGGAGSLSTEQDMAETGGLPLGWAGAIAGLGLAVIRRVRSSGR